MKRTQTLGADQMHNLQAHSHDEVDYVLDTDLAERLGMARPRDIRANLIEANREELESYGGLREVKTYPGAKGGRPGRVFYLNEEQAMLIAMFARTQTAARVRQQMIAAFKKARAESKLIAYGGDPIAAALAWVDAHKAKQSSDCA